MCPECDLTHAASECENLPRFLPILCKYDPHTSLRFQIFWTVWDRYTNAVLWLNHPTLEAARKRAQRDNANAQGNSDDYWWENAEHYVNNIDIQIEEVFDVS